MALYSHLISISLLSFPSLSLCSQEVADAVSDFKSLTHSLNVSETNFHSESTYISSLLLSSPFLTPYTTLLYSPLP